MTENSDFWFDYDRTPRDVTDMNGRRLEIGEEHDGHLAHVHGAAFTYADEGHAHLVQLGGPEAAHVDGAGLARGPRGHGTDVVRVRNDDLFGSQGSYFLGVGEGTGSQGASSQTQGLKETTA